MNYTTTINDASVYGITAAREAYNASLPATIKDGEADVPNPALIASDSAYLDFVLQRAIESWCKMYAPVVAPEVPPVEVNGVPQTVTMRQARLALLGAGKLSLVDAAIDGMPEPQKSAARIEWEYSNEVQRNNSFVSALGPALGMTEEQIDQLFIAAAKL